VLARTGCAPRRSPAGPFIRDAIRSDWPSIEEPNGDLVDDSAETCALPASATQSTKEVAIDGIPRLKVARQLYVLAREGVSISLTSYSHLRVRLRLTSKTWANFE
jgi:hypothetical protein